AEDGIRDFHVTGVQTCALPISAVPVDAWIFSKSVLIGKALATLRCLAMESIDMGCDCGITENIPSGCTDMRPCTKNPRSAGVRRPVETGSAVVAGTQCSNALLQRRMGHQQAGQAVLQVAVDAEGGHLPGHFHRDALLGTQALEGGDHVAGA